MDTGCCGRRKSLGSLPSQTQRLKSTGSKRRLLKRRRPPTLYVCEYFSTSNMPAPLFGLSMLRTLVGLSALSWLI